jgi:hypothetical protein
MEYWNDGVVEGKNQSPDNKFTNSPVGIKVQTSCTKQKGPSGCLNQFSFFPTVPWTNEGVEEKVPGVH